MKSPSLISQVFQGALRIFDDIWAKKVPFFATFFLILVISYGILFAIDFIPEAPAVESAPVSVTKIAEVKPVEVKAEPAKVVARYPERIKIDKLDLDVEVLNPAGDSIAELDAALLEGAVRHPGSADFKNTGTIFMFGHSSYLPIVKNQNFKAFNGIQKLTWGDTVRVQSTDTEYVYRVEKVYKAAASETEVTLSHESERLILVTCNSFASKDDRYVVEAALMSSSSL